jgi:aryl-alcohol dehydrogenase-like predicted oxidoreductase
MAAQKGVTAAQLAIAWVLSKGQDIVPIPGTKSIQRVKENIAAADLVLTSSDIAGLDSIAPIGATQGERYPAMNLNHIDR